MRSELRTFIIVWATVLGLLCAPASWASSGPPPQDHPQPPGAPARQVDAKPPTESVAIPDADKPLGKNSGSPNPAAAAGAAPQVAAPTDSTSAAPTVTVPSGVAGLQGLRVADVRFQSQVQLPSDRLNELLAQKANQPLDKNKIRRSIQALYATGRFADIQVEADRTPQNEVRLVFVAKENYFVGFMWVEHAPNPPTGNQLINASKLQLGEAFTAEKLESGIARVKRVLEDNGYYQSTITEEHTPHPDTQQMDIHFIVAPGLPARVGQVIVNGDAGYSAAEIESIAHLHPGDKITASRVNKALQRLRNKYQKKNRLEAQVAISNRVYHADRNTLDYVFNLVRGPTVDVHLEGAKLRTGKLKKYVPVYEENAVDDDLLNEGRRNIRDYFQTQGYFGVEVNWNQEYDPGADHRHIYYDVKLGERHKLIAVVLDGNKYFDDDLLRERMLTQPAGVLLSHGRFSESILVRDKESIESVYKANGFQNVGVKTEVQDDYKGETGHMRVVFHINEGPQTRVASLQWAGNKSVSEEELAALVNSQPGQPFSEFNMASDRDAILNYYFNRGFPNVQVETSTKPAGRPELMNVTYIVTEGDRVFVERVLNSGLQHTRPFVVDREFLLKPADPLSQVRMLSTQRRLYDLGIFNEVDMAVQNPEGRAESKNLLTQFSEAKRWTFTYGFGFEVQTGGISQACPGSSDDPRVIACRKAFEREIGTGKPTASPRVSLDVTRINFRGRDQTLVFKGNLGRLQKRALASFEAPRWFNRKNLKMTLTVFYDNSRDIRTFTSERIEGSGQIEHAVSNISTLLYRFTYRRVKADPATLLLSVEQVPLLSKPVRVGIPSITYIRDKRDNPIDSHKGNYTTFDFGTASSIFGSEANFNRMLLQNSTYLTFGKRKTVFARTTRIGFAAPFGGPVKDTNGKLVPAFIPLPERFFAGGGNSHRGFDLNGAGPRDPLTGAPLGGGGLFLNSVELRLPPPTLPFVEDNLSFVLFEDAGNVFVNPGDIWSSLFRVSQPHQDLCRQAATNTSVKCDFNYVSHAIGTGVRYKTPIGPVRVDVGYNLNPPIFPRQDLKDFHTLHRVNFYFSIGQTF